MDDGVGVSIRISNDVAAGEHCSIELLVHVPRRSLVGESMVAPRCDAVHTRRYRREQHDVLHPSKTARRDEATEEPWSNDAVVDRPVAAGDESAGRRPSRLGDDLVLNGRLDEPRIDPALPQNRKNSSPSIRTLGLRSSTKREATADLPAPGGPVTITSSAIHGCSQSTHPSRRRIR